MWWLRQLQRFICDTVSWFLDPIDGNASPSTYPIGGGLARIFENEVGFKLIRLVNSYVAPTDSHISAQLLLGGTFSQHNLIASGFGLGLDGVIDGDHFQPLETRQRTSEEKAYNSQGLSKLTGSLMGFLASAITVAFLHLFVISGRLGALIVTVGLLFFFFAILWLSINVEANDCYRSEDGGCYYENSHSLVPMRVAV